VALIEPRFEPSFFGLDHMLPLLPGQVRASVAGGALPLVAALVPAPHEVTIFSENVESVDLQALREFDIVGLTGMIVQRHRMQEILQALSDHPGVVVVGGPYASVDAAFFSGLCDVLFDGEADTTWPAFVAAAVKGEGVLTVYKQAERTDLSALPMPRYDLMPPGRYQAMSVQFSRGCPFLCDFCDIITIFGRVPRAKNPDQIIAELEALRDRGFRTVFLVDDNFIGNKKLARALLLRVVEWQAANGYPLRLTTEASINLADEPELLELMYRANFRSVFIGLETPNMESLDGSRKVQNVRGDSMAAKVDRVRDAGLLVDAGFMLGFDSDGPDIFERQAAFIRETRVARAAVSILTAIPSTPLFDRLKAEGRLRLDDPNCNFLPKQLSADQLRDGYLELTRGIYTAEAFFGRIFDSWNASESFRQRWQERLLLEPPASRRQKIGALVGTTILAARLARAIVWNGQGTTVSDYVRIWRRYRREGVPGIGLASFIHHVALHWHYQKYYGQARTGGKTLYNTYGYSQAARVQPTQNSA
jgi:radical SAM superfamily enzyme YgiQ (UPF0313 family)